MIKIYESLTSNVFFISSNQSSTGWFKYTKEYGIEDWVPWFTPNESNFHRALTNSNLKIYREIRKAIKEYK